MKKNSIKGASWDSIFLAFTKIITLLFGILSAKILSTGLTLQGYGTYSQANLIMTTGTSVILFGLGDALNYYFNNKDKQITEDMKSRIVNTVFFIEIVLGLILGLVVIWGKNLIAMYFSNDTVKNLLYVVAVLPVFSNIIYFMQVLCVAVGRAKKMSLYSLVLTIVRILAVYLSVYVLNNIIWIYVSILCMDIVNIILYNLDVKKSGVHINPTKISIKHIKPILKYGLPMGVYAITSTFTRDLDKLVVGRLGGTEELAIYTNCSKVLPLDFFVTSFAVVLIPYIYRRVSEGRREESLDLFSSYLKVGYYTVWTLGMSVLVAPKSIISFLYADIYVSGTAVFVLYIFYSMLRFASIHLILTAAGKSKRVMMYSIVSLILNLILNVLFYHMWGMIGPAISTLIVAVIYMTLILGDTIKILQAKVKDVFDFKDLLWFALSLLIVWFAAFILNHLLVNLGVHIYLSMIICMGFFGIVVFVVHFKKIFGVLKKINLFQL